jgi:NAD(P)H-hydrate repair Nnr-like enzyme with NAD(P)H-hydrate dehydratase domain
LTAVPTGSASGEAGATLCVAGLCRAGGASRSSAGAVARAALGFDHVVCAADAMGIAKARSSTEYFFIQSSE